MSDYRPMTLHQPMLFVGLGGTGCLVGAELERRLREELCGPDGTALVDLMVGKGFLPFQLPACLQFVYADLNEAELARLRTRVVATEQHAHAAERTLHLASDLVPPVDTYPEVAQSLRVNINEYVEEWLPPPAGEPKVAPLQRGAGQLPTVGRAALFETFRGGLDTALRPLENAIGALNNSGGDLAVLGGGPLRQTCDVFVAFSVAGGTGSGIFFDYLHLIGDALQRNGYRARIYPLVLMPSAFDDGMGGGRAAKLNAGRALLDLFRLVDDQNGQAAQTSLNDTGVTGALAVRYPVAGEVRLRASTVQTAFLFSRSAGVEREDLHRSVASLVISLVGTSMEGRNDDTGKANDRIYQSFADDFINRGVEREVPASTGVGNRGVSTSLVASMSVPVDELADVVSSRLLGEAVDELSVPAPGRAELNRTLIERCFTHSELEPLRLRTMLSFSEPGPAKGAEAIATTLRTRVRSMENAVHVLEQQLPGQVAELAAGFDPERAVEQLLRGGTDLFRVRRVMLGDSRLAEPLDRLGFAGVLEQRRAEAKPPAGVAMPAPQLAKVSNSLYGLRRLKWGDPEVQQMLRLQEMWYQWRTQRAWSLAWADHTSRWERKVRRLRRDLTAVTDAFVEHAQHSPARDAGRVRDLFRTRVGVSYLLPPQGSDLELFYQNTLRRIVRYRGEHLKLRANSSPGEILTALIPPEVWVKAYQTGVERGPAQAVNLVRDMLKQIVKQLFRQQEPGEQPLLPALADLLAAAAGKPRVPVGDEDLAHFQQKIASFVPGGFSPQGHGRMKVLVSYPALAADSDIEAYLDRQIYLQRSSDTVVEYRPVNAESVTVVFFRTSMAVTEVPELREVLRTWAGAVRAEEPQDFLKWRQRVGYDFGYLMTTKEHRVRIMQRFLCALWNDRVTVKSGKPSSPELIEVRLGTSNAVSMDLQLRPFARASSWASLLRAYEDWAITDDQDIRRAFCEQLMRTLPDGLEAAPRRPGDLYVLVRDLAETEVAVLDEMRATLPAGSGYAGLLRNVWQELVPEALDLPFEGVSNPVAVNLRDLEKVMQQ
ncbi:hypothetical protein Val02_52230 [Virgisporangium aliadipatigenens]|uniref:Tubulin-like protein n=1 Tax=Virgisporangium aliadipatigenens TaxID=741659 RepID=A0A8J3YPZ4_9ACTN|nr:tubulin-like doman-containing protein [Virgisporangium aliadipatigenens]GIJ48337.1 hypothetical protein Val02_52230 [Virgisporangium aliadipatigenens]